MSERIRGSYEGLEGGVLTRIPALFSRESRIPHVFHQFPESAFLSQKNTLKSLISTKGNK